MSRFVTATVGYAWAPDSTIESAGTTL